MTRAAIFDLDGTLIDSATDIHAAANAVLAEAGLPVVSFEQSRGFIGRGARVFAERMERAVLGANDPARTDHLHARFLHFYEHSHDNTRSYPHVADTLDALRAQGIRLGLCTNKPTGPTRSVLRHLNWQDMFDCVIGGDALAVAKPDPAPLLWVVRQLDLPLQDVTFIGDSETDAETAQAAQVRFGLFTEGYRKSAPEDLPHDFLFDDYRNLPGLLGHLVRP